MFNSPFFSWNLPWYQALVCTYPEVLSPLAIIAGGGASGGGGGGGGGVGGGFDPSAPLSEGGGASEYSTQVSSASLIYASSTPV